MKKTIILFALAIVGCCIEAKKVGVVNATQYPMQATIDIAGGGTPYFNTEPGQTAEYGTYNVLNRIDFKLYNKEDSATKKFDFNNNQGFTELTTGHSSRTFAGNTIGLYVVHQRDNNNFTVDYIEP